MGFVHLNVHTQYSLLEGAVKVADLVTRTKELGMPSVAITDSGNMFGAVDFYLAAKAAEIKPIIGCRVFLTTASRLWRPATAKRRVQMSAEEEENARSYHMTLLCKDAEGYRHLSELVTKSYTEGMLGRPRIDMELLRAHASGLICLSGGLKGPVAYHCATGRPDRGEAAAVELLEIFKEDFFLEMQEIGLPEQSTANQLISEIAHRRSIPLVATNEVHYLDKKQGSAHEVLLSVGMGRNIDEGRTNRLSTDEFYFKDEATMRSQFHWCEEAVDNTLLVAERCKFSFKMKDEKGNQIYHLPDFRPNEDVKDFTTEKYLREQAALGLEERFIQLKIAEEAREPYHTRLVSELDMIIRTGFAGYFLVVSDFIVWAKQKGIPVGPGRGSGAGSLVAYALKITDIDPIPFNLLFERFINPERISMPDFDIDFCQDRRQEVIDYVIQKYGRDKVSQIITFGKLLARGVIRDVGRVLNFSYAEVDQLAKLIPEELGITLEEALEKEPRLHETIDRDPRIARLFEVARSLEGLNRHASIHAAGVVITNRPLTEYCPLYTPKENETVVQFDKDFAEKIGLVKFDFLGLKTLTVIDNAVKFVRETQSEKGVPEDKRFELSQINYTDEKTFKLISAGDTDGVFQLESSGMKDLCMRVQPSNLEDITAINALYRPGPLNSGMVDDYIDRKHGRIPVEYELPQLEDILKETYGVIVYQEQVMRVARVLAGYSLGQADLLRRAMGKKKPEEMAKQRGMFLDGCAKNEIKKETAEHIFDLLAKFAEYGFNKSHSAAYGVLSFQTAYLKAYYPAQFMAALMATEMDNTDKMAQYIGDAKKRGLEILPPDVNQSKKTFSVVEVEGKQAIRFGLEAIKGVGGVAVEAILMERNEKGMFQDYLDFCKRVTLRKVNKKVLESLISVGAFDSLSEENRATLFESVETVMDYSAAAQEEADLGQVSMFDQYQASGMKLDSKPANLFKFVPEWPENQKLQTERALVGFYVSGHPMEKASLVAKNFVHGDLLWVKDEFERKKAMPRVPVKKTIQGKFGSYTRDESGKWDVTTAAIVGSFREIVTKKGTKMAFVEFEDAKTKIEGVCFPDAYEQFGATIRLSIDQCQPLIVAGQMSLDEEAAKIFIRSLDTIEDFKKKKVRSVVFSLDPHAVDAHKIAQLRAVLVKHRGTCSTFVEYQGSVKGARFSGRYALPEELQVSPTSEMIQDVNTLFGRDVVRFC